MKVAVLLCPEDSVARYYLGKCKESLIDDEGAIEDYTIAIQLDPSKPEALLARGSLYEALGQKEQAGIDFDTAVNLFPEMDSPYLERGKLKLEDGNLEGALIDFSKGLAINSRSWPLYSHRSCVFRQFAERVSMEEFSVLAQVDKREEAHYFETNDINMHSVTEFVPDLRLRQCD